MRSWYRLRLGVLLIYAQSRLLVLDDDFGFSGVRLIKSQHGIRAYRWQLRSSPEKNRHRKIPIAAGSEDHATFVWKRRRGVSSFLGKERNNVPILKLTIQYSLNLTAATHVHLVEPQWNPMVEAQAAARVDRLDQDHNVVILRYIVKDSIEEVLQ